MGGKRRGEERGREGEGGKERESAEEFSSSAAPDAQSTFAALRFLRLFECFKIEDSTFRLFLFNCDTSAVIGNINQPD